MSTLICTTKYRDVFGLPEKLSAADDEPNAILGPWYANALLIGPHRYLHYMSDRTFLPIVILRRTRETAETRMRAAVEELLRELGIAEAAIAAEMTALSSIAYARATNRSRLASMRDQATTVKFLLSERGERSPLVLTQALVDMPCAMLSYLTPRKATLRVFGAVHHPPPAP